MKPYFHYMKIEKFLKQSPSFQIALIGNLVFQKIGDDLIEYDLNMFEALILVSIFFEKEKSARPTQLKESFGIPKATISHHIRSLEKKKLLKRAMHETDARGYILGLTTKGLQISSNLISYFDKLQSRIERKCDTKTLNTFFEVLNEIAITHKK